MPNFTIIRRIKRPENRHLSIFITGVFAEKHNQMDDVMSKRIFSSSSYYIVIVDQ